MKSAWQKTTALFLSMILLFCYGKGQQKISETDSTGLSQEISLFRQQIIDAVKDKNQELLKQLYDSSKNIRYEKNLLFTIEEREMIALLSGDFLYLLHEKWEINDFAYARKTKKGKTVYAPKVHPKQDDLTKVLKDEVVATHIGTLTTIAGRDSLSEEERDLLSTKATMLLSYSLYDKKASLKLLDEKLLLYRKKYPDTKFNDQVKYIRRYTNAYKTGAFFGGGLSVGIFNNGVQKLFTNPYNWNINFDFYKKRIGWYLSYNITLGGFKNKVDTMFNDKVWPAGTRNFVSDFQAGFGYEVIKSNYIKAIIKTGLGSFLMRPSVEEGEAETNKIKLNKFPVISLGTCIDICNFRARYTEKKRRSPVGVRLFYSYNFLGFKNKYPSFPTNIQNIGIQLGLML